MVEEVYWKGKISKKFIQWLLEKAILFESRPARFKLLETDWNEEVIILE